MPQAKLDVVNGAVGKASPFPLAVAVGAGEAGAGQLQAGDALRLLTPGEADGLHGLKGEQGGRAAIKGLAKIWEPQAIPRNGMEQLAGIVHDGHEIAQGGHLCAGKAQDDGQVIGSVDERRRRLGAQVLQGGLEHDVGFVDDQISATDGGFGDITRHFSTPPISPRAQRSSRD